MQLHPLVSRGLLAVALLVAAGAVTQSPAQAETTLASQPYNWRNVEIVGGGFVPGIEYHPSVAGLVYARTDIGGAYRRDPGSNRWTPLLDSIGWDDWGLTGIASLALDPRNPDRVFVAAGTYTNDWDPKPGAILRSDNRGATWTRSTLPFKLGGNMPGRSMGERLAVDPNDGRVLYLAAPSGHGLWRSTDTGASWSKVNAFPNPGNYVQDPNNPYTADNIGVVWVTFDQRTGTAGSRTQTIYVGVADKASSVYRSTDGGISWSAVPGQPTGFLPHHGVLSPTGILYLPYNNNAGPYDGSSGDVWKYDTNTGVWTRISPVPSTDTSNNFFGYGGLSVDRQNPNVLMVSSLNSWWPDVMIWRSVDAGATWTRIWDWARYPNRTFRYTQDISVSPWLDLGTPGARDAEVSPKLGWMVGDLEIDPFNSNAMLYGTGATIYGSSNLTQWDAGNKIMIDVQAKGLEETAVLDLASPPSGPPLLSALGDIAGFRHDSLTVVPNTTFRSPDWSNTTSLDFAQSSPTYVVRVGNCDTGTICAGYSTNGGTSWTKMAKNPPGTTGGGTVAVGAAGGRVVWSPPGTGVHVTTSNGKTWTAATGIPAGAVVEADRVNGNLFYGYAAGRFYVSTNGGVSFTATAATGLPTESVQFKAVYGRTGEIWLTGGADTATYGMWRSLDSGATFTRIAAVEQADTIGFGAAAPGQSHPAVFTSAKIGGVRGIFRSDDAGLSWVRINDDNHQYGWTGSAITGDPRVYGRVYLGTNGRGILVADIA